MTVSELERRVKALEKQVKQLQQERAGDEPRQFDWEATVAKFKNDEHVLAVLADAMKLRERERQSVRRQLKNRRAAP